MTREEATLMSELLLSYSRYSNAPAEEYLSLMERMPEELLTEEVHANTAARYKMSAVPEHARTNHVRMTHAVVHGDRSALTPDMLADPDVVGYLLKSRGYFDGFSVRSMPRHVLQLAASELARMNSYASNVSVSEDMMQWLVGEVVSAVKGGFPDLEPSHRVYTAYDFETSAKAKAAVMSAYTILSEGKSVGNDASWFSLQWRTREWSCATEWGMHVFGDRMYTSLSADLLASIAVAEGMEPLLCDLFARNVRVRTATPLMTRLSSTNEYVIAEEATAHVI